MNLQRKLAVEFVPLMHEVGEVGVVLPVVFHFRFFEQSVHVRIPVALGILVQRLQLFGHPESPLSETFRGLSGNDTIEALYETNDFPVLDGQCTSTSTSL